MSQENSNEACAQCEANARWNAAGGYQELARENREYCRRGHVSAEEFALSRRASDYARNVIVYLGRPTLEWTDNKLVEALARAFIAGARAAKERP